MELYKLKSPKGANKHRKIRGRGPGSGHGKTSCRGNKGQKARSGHKIRLGFEGGQMPLIRRVPKRGFKSKSTRKFQIVNLKELNIFKPNTDIAPDKLKQFGLIKNEKLCVKILGEGEISRPLIVKAHSFAKTAKEKIEKAGGKTEILC